jgi:hypothetical protein
MTLKKLLTGFLLLIALMWLSGELLLKSDERSKAKGETRTATTTSEVAGAATTTSKSAIPILKQQRAEPSVSTSTPPAVVPSAQPSPVSATSMKDDISVTLSVDGKSFVHQLPKGASVATLLTTAQSAGELSFIGKDYSGLGMLIVGINSKLNNQDKNNLYWIYSVNGQKAQKGVSEYVLAAGDTVSWSYEQNTY